MSRLKISDITIENHGAVYDYYQAHRAHPLPPRVGYLASDILFRPAVNFAEGTQEHLAAQQAAGSPTILVANHVRYIDHYIIGGTWHSEPAMQHFMNTTEVFAKAPYFSKKWSRWRTEQIGGVPVWRERDFAPEKLEEMRMQLGRAGLALIGMTVKQMLDGRNVFMFPEGTRNIGDKSRVLALDAGIGHLAVKAWRAEELKDVSIVPIGISYNMESDKNWRNSSVHVGTPIYNTGQRQHKDVTEQVQVALQESVDNAQQKIAA